ncbi:NAD(P)/FAD-dependent oxidoreductase [Sporomusa termitida]|uniref:Uncharacterized protein n=1 Tax=Sporomusa termitida TaxID=2377 RepID=A0A517DNJ3_9FIRM|nr:NAD(P)-binding protein [Sporomusa termitida]QDR78867.1 hypothetical protein SPTER_01170 [Sporomusa termitida]
MLKISNFRIPLTEETPLAYLVARRLRLAPEQVSQVNIIRRAIDARRKHSITFVYTLAVELLIPPGQALSRLAGDKDVVLITPAAAEDIVFGAIPLNNRPVVVGSGPAGLFAALMLARYGYKPLLIERGRDVERRARDIADFWRTGQLAENSNVQFGEGGAGTFSDGKLTTRVTDPRMAAVLDIMITAGAPAEIKYLHKPHIGTDKLRQVVRNIRTEIIKLGGDVEFEACLTGIATKAGQLTGITVNGSRHIPCEILFLAIGHSARDTYQMLHEHQVAMAAKPFAIGVRIEHPQELIDTAQYGVAAGHPRLGPADYALVYQDKAAGRAAYSFCMCPGGLVVAAASEAGGVVTNGMSLYKRDSGLANSAVAVTVNPADYGPNVLDGIEFQRRYERLAFALGGNNYNAPVQTVGDFLTGKSGSAQYLAASSYRPGTTPADLRQCLPGFVATTLAKALPDFGRKLRGFDHRQAVLTGVETRTSAPVRLVRGPDFVSINTTGVYPIGEGAGYAGGIMSAALDGVNAAISFVQVYKA